MKKIIFLLLFITAIPVFILAFAYNDFQDGNKLYLNGDYQGALEKYSSFINKKTGKYEGYYNAGDVFYRMGQYDKAAAMFERALKLNPNDADAAYNLELAMKKMQEQPQQSQKQGSGQKGQQGNGQQQSGEGKNVKGAQENQQNGAKSQQSGQKSNENGKNQQAAEAQEQAAGTQARPSPGMSDDEVQALLNSMQNQEKQLRGYFGKQQQQRPKTDQFGMPDLFNMSPQEIMQYMQNRANGVYNRQQKQSGPDEKNW